VSGEQTIVDSLASQPVFTRYGDYTAMMVDPVDGCTFWYTNEYIPANGRWTTQIASFLFPTCFESAVPPNDLCADAIDLGTLVGPPLNVIGTTIGATVDNTFPNPCTNGEPLELFGGANTITSPGIWHTFESDLPCISASTCFGVISVYVGNTCENLVCVDGNDDADGACGLQSFTGPFPLEAMMHHYVLVHGFGIGEGDFEGDFSLILSAANGCKSGKKSSKKSSKMMRKLCKGHNY